MHGLAIREVLIHNNTHLVYDNKISPDARGLPQLDKRKARMVVDGNPMSMQKGVHYAESFSATPKIETCRLMVVLRVLLRLAPRWFDASNAYAWAGRSKMIALRYPRGTEQYRDGKEVYMRLQKNTYGTPDGGFLWAEERTTMLFKHFSKQPWTITRCLRDQCLFYSTYTTEIRVGQSDGLRSGSAARTFRTAEERLVID